MKGLCVVLVILSLVAPAATVSAYLENTTVSGSTLENKDGQSYVVDVIDAGQMYRVTLLDGATISLCDYGCAIRLVATGQTLAVEPNDSVVISYGVLRVK